jgi:predicted chitinase
VKLTLLQTISEPRPIGELSEEQLRELQTALSILGYPVGDIDGLIGPKTRSAWGEFEADFFEGDPDLIGPDAIETLQKQVEVAGLEKDYDFSTKDGTMAAIKQECRAQGIGLKTQIAYVLATVEWETARTFRPVKEAYWNSEEWRRDNLRYYPYYGRGYVQLTWKNNYEKYSKILGIDLVNNTEMAMEPNIALFILVHGFKTGTFTGRKITEYIDSHKTDFLNARRCINGRNKAHEIKKLAEKYLQTV